MSHVASGTINSVNVEKALLIKGVIGYIDASDVPGSLWIGHGDTPVFAKDKVNYFELNLTITKRYKNF